MKFPGEAAERVARALLAHGPQTASELADALDLTPAGVRRQLASLVDAGLVVAHDRVPYGPTPRRGRGRPGSVFGLTDAGRAACDAAYDDLALGAVRFLKSEFGTPAVEAFARERAETLLGALVAEQPAPPQELARVLTAAGYAAEIAPLGEIAVQLCQHSCPIIDVAREFPELCEAETEQMGRVLDRHVTRLATLAHGDGVCTTVIPLNGAAQARAEADPMPSQSSRNRRKVLA